MPDAIDALIAKAQESQNSDPIDALIAKSQSQAMPVVVQGGKVPGLSLAQNNNSLPSAGVQSSPSGSQSSQTQTLDPSVNPATDPRLQHPLLEKAIDTAISFMPLGPAIQMGLNNMGGKNPGKFQNTMGVINSGLSLIPGFGASDAALKTLMGGAAGATAGAVLPQLATEAAGGTYSPAVGKYVDPVTSIIGAIMGGKIASPSPTEIENLSSTFGKLSPGQAQIVQGAKGLTPEIEREALNRSSNPIQALARNQAETMSTNLNDTLGKVAPIQEPVTAAANFGNKFEGAQNTASNAMDEIDNAIQNYDKTSQTVIDPTALRSSVEDAIRHAGWPVENGIITANPTAKGFSQPAADVLQKYLDLIGPANKNGGMIPAEMGVPGIPGDVTSASRMNNGVVNSVEGLRNLRQNFGKELDQAGQQSGTYANNVKNGVYGALSNAEQSSLPPDIAGKIQSQNQIYSGLKGIDNPKMLGASLDKDPTKFWDTFLNKASNNGDFMNNVQNFMGKTGMGTQDLQSVAVSNIADKVKTALNNPAKDDIGRLTSGITALQKEVARIPSNAQAGLLGEALPQLQSMISDGNAIREWANKLPNNSGTAVTGVSHAMNYLANGIESIAGRFPLVGHAVGNAVSSGVRKIGSLANDSAMSNYLNQVAPNIPKVNVGGWKPAAKNLVDAQALISALAH